jgi:hypothetical protein
LKDPVEGTGTMGKKRVYQIREITMQLAAIIVRGVTLASLTSVA